VSMGTKLKLDLDTLAVDSFVTLTDAARHRGTVRGLSLTIVAETAEELTAEGVEPEIETGEDGEPVAQEPINQPVAGDPQAIEQIADMPEENPVAGQDAAPGGQLPAVPPAAVSGNPILTSIWNLAKAVAPTVAQQALTFGVMYGATVAAAQHVKSSNAPQCLTAYLSQVQTNWENEFGAGSFTPALKAQVAQGCLQYPTLYNAGC